MPVMPEAGPDQPCLLALEDGSVFRGRAIGARGTRSGEVVFNTSMTGYQEILTDPSYCGQIVTLTHPQVGNYGVNEADVESGRVHVSGFVVRESARRHSNHRATCGLNRFLIDRDVVAIGGIDTRALTRRLREHGTLRGVVSSELDDAAACVEAARRASGLAGADLVRDVAPHRAYVWSGSSDNAVAESGTGAIRRRIVAVDCGAKYEILRRLGTSGHVVTVVPPTVSASDILDRAPHGVFVSNGPGDPAAVTYLVELLRRLMGRIPIFGICLGHQVLALALGARSFKLKYGHRGANQPVRNLMTDRIEITTQNHGFAIDTESLRCAGGLPTHINLNDETLEGFTHPELPILGVQYHPEASPGPHDSRYLFRCFRTMMVTGRPPSRDEFCLCQGASAAAAHADQPQRRPVCA